MSQARRFFSTPQAAKQLGLSARTLEQYRRTGEGPVFHRFGCLVRYLGADLDAWAAARRRISTDDDWRAYRSVMGSHRRKPPRCVTGGQEAAQVPVCANGQIGKQIIR